MQTYRRLGARLQSHAGVYPRRQALTSQEKALAKFANNARGKYHRGQLSDYHRDQLLLLREWSWGVPRSTAWDGTLLELQQWLATHDNDYPRRHSEHREEKRLAKWINNRREDYGGDRLSGEQVDRLEGLPGWTWHSVDSSWDHTLEELDSWLEANNNVYPPQRSDDSTEQRLGQRVNNQRRAREHLPQARQARLEALPN